MHELLVISASASTVVRPAFVSGGSTNEKHKHLKYARPFRLRMNGCVFSGNAILQLQVAAL
jgi:hypothetical protein